jgi:hypothetical protein
MFLNATNLFTVIMSLMPLKERMSDAAVAKDVLM